MSSAEAESCSFHSRRGLRCSWTAAPGPPLAAAPAPAPALAPAPAPAAAPAATLLLPKVPAVAHILVLGVPAPAPLDWSVAARAAHRDQKSPTGQAEFARPADQNAK